MTSATLPATFSREGFQSWLAQLSEPLWLTDLRRSAWKSFENSQWPDRTQEEWMRSDLRPFKLDRYSLPGGAAGTTAATAAPLAQWLSEGVTLAGRVETFDGANVRSQLEANWQNKGGLFGDLSQHAAEHEQIGRPALFSVVDPAQDRFAALHAAAWSGGQLLYVPRGVCLTEPLYISNAMSDGGSDLGHTLIILEDGAEATVLHETGSVTPTAGGFHCGSVEVIVKSNAHLRYVNLQDWGRSAWHFAHHRATIDRNATMQWTIAAMGSRFAQVSQQVALVGKGASSQVNGVMFTQDSQHMTYNTLQHHIAPACRSDFLYKAALQDQSRTVWRGMIQVDANAQKTDGYQRNDNLLLSELSRADSIPGLEILADDVRCTHGSTSGKVDEELIFYARSRGFTRKEAIRMIVTGFFQQIFDRITIERVRDALGQAIARQVREYQ
ncbi:MAG: Fe-S cluster assembly protein SufD [Pirellulaceae bacterium]|nr:Fe-S cluster assembly protein SufD [Pirellulaceae bacterium]